MEQFILAHTYDIRATHNGRWIDQKCTIDELCFVADCIVNYLDEGGQEPFESPDIWRTEYATYEVQKVFCKPDPHIESTKDEYNKFFRQPMKMLAAAGVLNERKEQGNNAIQFSVANKHLLEYISLRERNCFDFLCAYIEKTLKDSDLWDAFESFFDEQTPDSYNNIKDAFVNFCIKYTPINTQIEARRIFAKVLNPLAIRYRKLGTIKGRISQNIITMDEILYNRINFRDQNKDKNVSRGEAALKELESHEEDVANYMVRKAMNRIKRYNDKYNHSKSEITDELSIGYDATNMHHIFPKNQYPTIADYVENLIALTSAQHFQKAHPAGNTSVVDLSYQYICLINKTASIRKNLIENFGEPFYNFDAFMRVLDTGLKTDYFQGLNENDFPSVIRGIELNYPTKKDRLDTFYYNVPRK